LLSGRVSLTRVSFIDPSFASWAIGATGAFTRGFP
jgi:hypothetical protein